MRSVAPSNMMALGSTLLSTTIDMSYSNCDMPVLSLSVRSVEASAASLARISASMPRIASADSTAMMTRATMTSTSVNPDGRARRTISAPSPWRS